MRSAVRFLVVALISLVVQKVYAALPSTFSASAIDAAAIEKIPVWHGGSATVLSHLDLTQPFRTRSQSALVVLNDPHLAASGSAPLAVCFVQRLAAQCTETPLSVSDPAFCQWRLIADHIVFAGPGNSRPRLWLKTFFGDSMDGNGIIEGSLFRYDRGTDRFIRVFKYGTVGSNNNQNATFVSHGPIMGDVITDYPTEDAPFTYWVEVYGPRQGGKYVRILRYRGHTGYGDGNPLPVADSEMPEILRRLGHWKPGEPLPTGTALPVPSKTPCSHPVLRHGEEWCQPKRVG